MPFGFPPEPRSGSTGFITSLVDDPSSLPEQFPTEADQDKERQRLFRLIEEFVLWENSNNRTVLDAAYQEILKSTEGKPPPIYDPFCGGGSIPLEAQRLGLKAYGSDLNPVAVLITKALIEIPPKFAGQPPVNPSAKKKMTGKGMWTGARGLADDVRHYGQWMRDKAEERIGKLYPKAKLPNGEEATVIAWLWTRTIQCPNPACGTRMPLVRSLALSTKSGKKALLHPTIDNVAKRVRFEIHEGEGAAEGTVNRKGARCLACGTAVGFDYIRAEGRAGGISAQMMAIVAQGARGRAYLNPVSDQDSIAASIQPTWRPDTPLPQNPRDFKTPNYGMGTFGDLFTPRQLVALSTFSDLVTEAREQTIEDGASSEYANAIATYLAFAVDKGADYWSSICSWHSGRDTIRNTFGRQAIPMVWDFAEGNPFSDSTGNWTSCIDWVWKALEGTPARGFGNVRQLDATTVTTSAVFSTDPPYYDNIGYADLSDFFYVWLRRSIGGIYPDVCSTLLVPKKQELVATPYRFEGSKQRAQEFFEEGFAKAFVQIRAAQEPGFPMTVYYAFKQAETDEDNGVENSSAHASTGWETMLEGLLRANFQVTGTWPMRSELTNRMMASGTNALASSIVLACRPRLESATITTRKDFLGSLKKELPHALRNLQKGNIAPVDLAQAAIGPGMAVFSRYKKVLETDGSPMRVRTALGLINQGLDEVLSELESEFDSDTRWALAWFEQHQFDEGPYGEAEVLATAKALSISHLAEAGILRSGAGKVRLLRREDLPEAWDPSMVARLTVWEVTQHLIRSLDQKGETETANLKAKIGGMAEIARDLAYRLYTLCERKGWAEEAGYYNSLVVAWPSMASEAFELS
jgi:putative DNA methylase